jgi:hypothetical protein
MSEADNVRHWPPSTTGVYEVWYTTWNHPTTGEGYWLRFILESPHAAEPRGELWFARFDPRDPHRTFGIHKHFPIAQAEVSDAPFRISIAGSVLGHSHSSGELEGGGHSVRWDLRWDPAPETLRFLPDVMYLRGGLGETTVHSPNPRVPLSGRLLVDGEEIAFDRAIAGQTHLWGKKHAYSWVWARCAEFTGAPDGLLEILGVRLKRRGVTLPKLVLVHLHEGGERHDLSQFRHVAANRGSWEVGRVTFTARSPRVKIEGELTCTPDDMVNAPYVDPDGTELYCANTEIGSARVTVWKRDGVRWREHRRLESRGRAHFEIGSRTRDPLVARPHELI